MAQKEKNTYYSTGVRAHLPSCDKTTYEKNVHLTRFYNKENLHDVFNLRKQKFENKKKEMKKNMLCRSVYQYRVVVRTQISCQQA